MRRCGRCFLASVLAVAALAQEGPAGPMGRLRTIDGRELHGRLTIAAEGRVTLTGDTAIALDVAQIAGFEQDGAVPSRARTPHLVWLRSGQLLPVTRLSGKPKAQATPALLVAELPCGASIELPLAMLRAVRHGGEGRPEPALFAHDLQQPSANDDLIYVLKDGQAQRSSVTVTDLGPERIDFQLRGSAYDFEWSGLAGIVFGTNTGFAPDRQPKPRTRVEMTTGEVLEGRLLALGDRVQLRLDEGAVVAVPSASMMGFSVASDRLVWLGDLSPAVEQTPAFDRVWAWSVGRSVAGPGFVLGGKNFTRGIGLVPKTKLTYDLGGRYDLFEATIGIDDRGGPEAHAVFRVFVDGALAFESTPKTLATPPEVVRIELKQAKTLALEVDFGKNYDLGDYCAFADARVVQQ